MRQSTKDSKVKPRPHHRQSKQLAIHRSGSSPPVHYHRRSSKQCSIEPSLSRRIPNDTGQDPTVRFTAIEDRVSRFPFSCRPHGSSCLIM
eukprot:3201277-Amphidinium_carterae.2